MTGPEVYTELCNSVCIISLSPAVAKYIIDVYMTIDTHTIGNNEINLVLLTSHQNQPKNN